MTPKEKEDELFLKFAMYLRANLMHDEDANEDAKQCALIAVDEIVEIFEFMVVASNLEDHQLTAILNYWDKVKEEIEAL